MKAGDVGGFGGFSVTPLRPDLQVEKVHLLQVTRLWAVIVCVSVCVWAL